MRILVCLLLGLGTGSAVSAADERPATWAQPVANDAVQNLFQVAPNIYRCAQPDAAGMQALEALGVKRIIELRNFHSDKDEINGTALIAEDVGINTWALEDEDVIRVLRILKDPSKGPFLIHCLHGADRTGTMCAMYRMVVQGWSKDDAIREMTEGGFGYHAVWTNLIRYLRNVDVERIRKAVDAP